MPRGTDDPKYRSLRCDGGSLTDAGLNLFFYFSSSLVCYHKRVRRLDKNKKQQQQNLPITHPILVVINLPITVKIIWSISTFHNTSRPSITSSLPSNSKPNQKPRNTTYSSGRPTTYTPPFNPNHQNFHYNNKKKRYYIDKNNNMQKALSQSFNPGPSGGMYRPC